ncbi:TATA-binding protein-associated transcription initiation factor Mot1 [Schizosaccharomyces pombe]|uniref:TATA-binding protein-associated factor mot1 n=1 Tax=Schizosaccharomyces pombe (strain 972 / ATCC 24843) TaxID=284812 RepID=BTAF1_SCHPO|nr:putative TATA-binding protein-associated factor Mot1 [Schizosaccharomyces pombe]O43065.4 RecName: Full=TATA-binding protein-associated factor mot1; AltName: Full=Modifier of transcription 1; AltName: Full=TBP-associated factor mot1 [Schizosaccharomyces pombe 972h-]CAA21270.2 TATA-binding protein associated factor Mot1 (predicted) [Schizosaccharomyces pombe]|eukprot:NP_596080.2 putative TATA-binding protein-associated factor Mot1 [Schizosaccharomyces pombe]
MTTRLDRLVVLLDSGSTSVVRETAAKQIGDIQKVHPDELYNLLGRVVPYLKSKNWDTRVAAAKAIGGIVENVPVWNPNRTSPVKKEETEDLPSFNGDTEEKPFIKTEEGAPASSQSQVVVSSNLTSNSEVSKLEEERLSTRSHSQEIKPIVDFGPDEETAKELNTELKGKFENSLLSFESFDIANVLKAGKKLLGSASRDYDVNPANYSTHYLQQLSNLKSRLDLAGEYLDDSIMNDLGDNVGSNSKGSPTTSIPEHKTSINNNKPEDTPTPSENVHLSARQRNALKRKARQMKNSQKVRVIDVAPTLVHQQNSTSSADKKTGADYNFTAQSRSDRLVVEHKAPIVPSAAVAVTSDSVWPFETLVELLLIDMFDPSWEIRHGACMGLREIIRYAGFGYGRVVGKSEAENEQLNKKYFDDLLCRIACVFALDRFGDYLADQVVAPIRESVSQVLGVALIYVPNDSVFSMYKVLHSLVFQNELGLTNTVWEAAHGGMLGIKYLVAVKYPLFFSHSDYLDSLINTVIHGLANHDDDVRAVSALTLLPIADKLVQEKLSSCKNLLKVLWDCLDDVKDDLSSSTSCVMDLLSSLCSFTEVMNLMQETANSDPEFSFETLVPRLFHLMRYTLTGVRRSVVYALTKFISVQTSCSWITGLTLRLCFQNVLLEQQEDISKSSCELAQRVMDILYRDGPESFSKLLYSHIEPMLKVSITPIGSFRRPYPLDTTLIVKPSGQPYAPSTSRERNNNISELSNSRTKHRAKDDPKGSFCFSVDEPMLNGDVEFVGEERMLKARLRASSLLGRIIGRWKRDEILLFFKPFLQACLTSSFSTPVVLGSRLIESFFEVEDNDLTIQKDELYHLLCDQFATVPRENYANLVSQLHVVRAQCNALLNTFLDVGRLSRSKIPSLAVVVKGDPEAGPIAFGIADAEKLVGPTYENLCKLLSPSQKAQSSKALNEIKYLIIDEISIYKIAKERQDIQCSASIASAMVTYDKLPKKLNSIIKGIMESIKKEQFSCLQMHSASAMMKLISACYKESRQVISEKIVRNLCAYVCMDTTETPIFHDSGKNGILSLHSIGTSDDNDEQVSGKLVDDSDDVSNDRKSSLSSVSDKDAAVLQRMGAQLTLQQMAQNFGSSLFSRVPVLSQCLFVPLQQYAESGFPSEVDQASCTVGQDLLDAMSILRFLVAYLDSGLQSEIVSTLPHLLATLQSNYSAVRNMASKCFAAITESNAAGSKALHLLVEDVVPLLGDASSTIHRQGAIECIYHVVQRLGVRILPYILYLIIPLLGRMSDADQDVRVLATTSFATLVKLVPLEAGLPDPPDLPQYLLDSREKERKFLEQMLNPSKVEAFSIPVPISADLRKYQQEGVNWLAFLNKYELHGILCDDMGLGKTLQTICIVASDHYNRQKLFEESGSPKFAHVPSLIVCPSTLAGHWQQELSTYAPFLKVSAYVGPPAERAKIRSKMKKSDVVVTSYDICRNDVDELVKIDWNYCVLDEGHVIKNARAKLTKAVKSLRSYHRLILSGTPIQNNVLELWSLFDFLMPGFLGTEKTFQERFVRPIAASRDAKSSSKERERGTLALEAIHKQVLPFMLRRLKEDVLADLPPKIIQDYYCDMSDLQRKLLNDFVSQLNINEELEDDETEKTQGTRKKKSQKAHIFQALQYMRKLCNHPALILTEKHPKRNAIVKQLAKENSGLHDLKHAPKLTALGQLLRDCGLGNSSVNSNGIDSALTNAVSEHRVLIFCQLKDMLDMVEKDLLQATMPDVTYMRLDGSVEPTKRQEAVTKFNNDPSIDVLLLTTHVGGLGLNLTGADTVIFVEHDWNPMRDLQAMDRAHRIGQKKVVNVYRLITRGCLEEKIMGLQRFKMNVASTVVNQQNAGLSSIGTDQILDLFNTTADEQQTVQNIDKEESEDAAGRGLSGTSKKALEGLPEMWDESQYDEFNLDGFISTLPKDAS